MSVVLVGTARDHCLLTNNAGLPTWVHWQTVTRGLKDRCKSSAACTQQGKRDAQDAAFRQYLTETKEQRWSETSVLVQVQRGAT